VVPEVHRETKVSKVPLVQLVFEAHLVSMANQVFLVSKV
jgi:hypothetical protein